MKASTVQNITKVRDFLSTQEGGVATLPEVVAATSLKNEAINGLSGAWSGPRTKPGTALWHNEKKGGFTILVLTEEGRAWTAPEKKATAVRTKKEHMTAEEAKKAVLAAATIGA